MEIKIDKLIRSKRRSIGLEITEEAQLIIRAPRLASLKYINKVVESKRNWIEKKLKLAKNQNSNFIPKLFTEGEEYLYLGHSYKLSIIKDARQRFEFDDNFILSAKWQIKAKALFTYWYRQQAKKIITERVEYYAQIYEFHYGDVKINGAKKRWGSCTGKNNLNFTWRLMMAPIEIIDSVVVHELVHTKIKNHSKNFWTIVYEIMPDYPKHNKWLKQNGYLLNLE